MEVGIGYIVKFLEMVFIVVEMRLRNRVEGVEKEVVFDVFLFVFFRGVVCGFVESIC